MGQNLRYKIEHMGDSFIDLLEKIPDAAKESLGLLKKVPDIASGPVEALKKIPDIAKDPIGLFKKVPDAARSSARGVILTYDIHEYEKKKEKLVNKIGGLFLELRKEGRETNIVEDETMKALLSEADEIERTLSEFTIERTERLYPSEKTDETSAGEEKEAAEEIAVSAEQPETDTEEMVSEVPVEEESSLEEAEIEEAGAEEEPPEAVIEETVSEEPVEEESLSEDTAKKNTTDPRFL